jgi:hypothetical protein
MNLKSARIAVATICVFAALDDARAAISERNFRVPGDGLLTYDAINHREWLDVTETAGMSLEDVGAQIQPAGLLFGFSIATTDDVMSLVISAGYDRNDPNQGTQFSKANTLIDLLGETLRVDTTFNTSSSGIFGWDDSANTLTWRVSEADAKVSELTDVVIPFAISTTGLANVGELSFVGTSKSFVGTDLEYPLELNGEEYRGVWLYRNVVVPEPTSFGLLTVALMLCAILDRNRRYWTSASM